MHKLTIIFIIPATTTTITFSGGSWNAKINYDKLWSPKEPVHTAITFEKAAQKEKFKMCKADVLSDVLLEELDNVVQILEPLKLFIRDNDGSLKLSDGNALGHTYYNFYKLHQYYLSSNAIKA